MKAKKSQLRCGARGLFDQLWANQAFGFRPNAWACEVKLKGSKLLNRQALLGRPFKIKSAVIKMQ